MTLLPKPAAERARAELSTVEQFEQALGRSDATLATAETIDVAHAVLVDLEQAVAAAQALRARLRPGEALERLESYVVRASASILRARRKEGELLAKDKELTQKFTGELGSATTAKRLMWLAKIPTEVFDGALAEAIERGREPTQKDLLKLVPKKPRRSSGKPTVGETQVAARIDAELLALVDDMAKRTKTDRAEVARRALEVYLRPEASDAHEVLQRALLPLTFERRLLAKIELAADEATYCAGKFGERPWKAIARALEGARAEALKLAGVEDDGMELEP